MNTQWNKIWLVYFLFCHSSPTVIYLSIDELHTYNNTSIARYDIEREKNSRDMNVTFRQYRVSRAIGERGGKIQLPLFRGDTAVFVVE